jgi:hypothetical protein
MLRQQRPEFIRRLHLDDQRVRLRGTQGKKEQQGFAMGNRQDDPSGKGLRAILGGARGSGKTDPE